MMSPRVAPIAGRLPAEKAGTSQFRKGDDVRIRSCPQGPQGGPRQVRRGAKGSPLALAEGLGRSPKWKCPARRASACASRGKGVPASACRGFGAQPRVVMSRSIRIWRIGSAHEQSKMVGRGVRGGAAGDRLRRWDPAGPVAGRAGGARRSHIARVWVQVGTVLNHPGAREERHAKAAGFASVNWS